MEEALITYATWAGSTKQIAERIAKVLNGYSYKTTVSSVNSINGIEKFNLIIAGSSIHAGRVIINYKKFLQKNNDVLATKPIALFVSCANMINDNADTRAETLEWLNKALIQFPGLKPISIGLFAGAALTNSNEYKKQNFLIKKIIAAMHKSMVSEYGQSDFRDWEKIDNWTKDLITNVNSSNK